MDDDFNTALAIGHIFEFIRALNNIWMGNLRGPRQSFW